MTEGHKVILKPEIPMMSWVKPRRFYNKMEMVYTGVTLPGECKEEILTSRETVSPELTFELLEEQPETIATWIVLYEQLSSK